jgi:hypothetical protein
MSLLPRLLAAAPSTALSERPSVLENLEFQAVGLLIVVGALTALYLICGALGFVFRRLEQTRRAPPLATGAPHAPDPAPAAAAATAEEVPLVAIAAAVAAVVCQPHRLVKVAPPPSGWSLEGRRQLLGSHRLRP